MEFGFIMELDGVEEDDQVERSWFPGDDTAEKVVREVDDAGGGAGLDRLKLGD